MLLALQLDGLCVRLLHPETGVAVKQQKYFRVAVPHAFTGYELVQWLQENLRLDDTGRSPPPSLVTNSPLFLLFFFYFAKLSPFTYMHTLLVLF